MHSYELHKNKRIRKLHNAITGMLRVVGGRIVYGSTVTSLSTTAQLLRDERMTCSAVIIEKSWALTAAHCVYNTSKTYHIKTGVDSSACEETTMLDAVYVHPAYRHGLVHHDISVLHLERPLTCNYTFPIMTTVRSFKGVHVCGFGIGSLGRLSCLGKNVLPRSYCTHVFRQPFPNGVGYIPNGTFCAMALMGDSCNGDSGGPVFTDDMNLHSLTTQRTELFLVGIVSFGPECGLDIPYPKYPAGYVELTPYLGWISNTMLRHYGDDASSTPPVINVLEENYTHSIAVVRSEYSGNDDESRIERSEQVSLATIVLVVAGIVATLMTAAMCAYVSRPAPLYV